MAKLIRKRIKELAVPTPLFIDKSSGGFMEEKIEALYKELTDISAEYLIYQRRDNVEKIKKIIPQIQEFVLWFLEGNKFGIELVDYQDMCRNLLEILEDILCALKQGDRVLMHDATANGLMEYLRLFVGQEEINDDFI